MILQFDFELFGSQNSSQNKFNVKKSIWMFALIKLQLHIDRCIDFGQLYHLDKVHDGISIHRLVDLEIFPPIDRSVVAKAIFKLLT